MSNRLDLSRDVLGVIGGGQLGRMLIMAARRMNLKTVVWTGGLDESLVDFANEVVNLPFDDPQALERFCAVATVATVEFENIPAPVLEAVAQRIGLHPSPQAVAICQNREREKNFLRDQGIPCAAFAVVSNSAELAEAMHSLGAGMLKTADFGYDGNGQIRVKGDEDPQQLWQQFGAPKGVYEQWVSFEREVSVMVARGADGACVSYGVAENCHRDQILDITMVPAAVNATIAAQAAELAKRIAVALDYRGIMGVEFFVKSDGELFVNEMAPRPHNSGHYTMDACVTSQFEQQLRAVMGLPLGSTRLLSPVVMLNLLGDLWPAEDRAPDWNQLFADGEASLHLYGKARATPRRKMGHANVLGASVDDALARVNAIKDGLLESAKARGVNTAR